MSRDNIQRAAERTFAVHAVYGISVEGVIDATVQEACQGERIASYRRVRLSTFGRVRETEAQGVVGIEGVVLDVFSPRWRAGLRECRAVG